MFEHIHAFLTEAHAFVAVFVSSVILLAQLLTMLTKAINHNTRYFSGRRLKRLRLLVESAPNDPMLRRYLDDAIALESFRAASGISTSKARMHYLIRLSNTGLWNRSQIRALTSFLKTRPDSSAVEIQITMPDKIGAGLGLMSGIALLFLGMLYFLSFSSLSLGWGLIPGALLWGSFILVGRLFATDFVNYLTVKRVLKHLKNAPLPETDRHP